MKQKHKSGTVNEGAKAFNYEKCERTNRINHPAKVNFFTSIWPTFSLLSLGKTLPIRGNLLSSQLLTISRLLFIIVALSSLSQAQSDPASFARIGLNAKGMSLGNSVSAVTSGNVYTYYNPALASFQNGGSVAASVALLSLDRQLNVLTYTQSLKPTAGLSLGIVNATVSNIDGRDIDGNHTENLSTSENLIFFSFSNRFTENLSIGLSLKVYYYDLYSGITSTSVGFDLGAAYKITNEVSVAMVATDLGERYKWDSSKLYGTDGSSFTTKFPNVFKIGLSYKLPFAKSVISAEYDVATSNSLNGLRAGLEVSPISVLTLRAGFISYTQQYVGTKITPSFGFGAAIPFLDFTPEINYAYVAEPFSPYGIQTISLIIGF
jgi:hypothetical protein